MSDIRNNDAIIYLIIFIIISIIFIPFIGKHLFLLDLSPRMGTNQILDLIYGKTTSERGGLLPFILISIKIFQKLLIIAILFYSAYLMYDLTSNITSSRISQTYAGLLYAINPYVYIRILTGQLLIILPYAIFPLLLKTFIEILEKKGKKEIIKFELILSVIAFSIHILIISLIVLTVIFLFWFNKHRDIKIPKIIILSIVLFVILNSYWIVPVITTKNTIVGNIEDKDLEVFAPNIKDGLSGWLEIAAMYGFWREGYLYAKDFLPGWQILYFIILSLAIIGFIYYCKDNGIGIYVQSFLVIGVLGFILASGIKGPFSDQMYWLFDNTILKGFRDSQKFVGMLVLTYSLLGGIGLSKFEEYRQKHDGRYKIFITIIIGFILIIPLIYSFTFFNGFSGQIRPTDYPSDWYEVNNYLNNDSQDFKVLFLPWHQYMKFSWINNSNKMITNPSKNFFDKDIISGTNIENRLIYREDNSPDQLYIDFVLKNRNNITNIGELLSILNIKYVILAKDQDYKKYKFLFDQKDLELINDTKTLYLFKNNHNVSKIYSVDEIIYIKDWNDLLQRSKYEDITDKLYIIGNGSSSDISNNRKVIINYEKINPVDYKLDLLNAEKYLVYTESYSNNWKFNNDIPIKAYGVVNGYNITGNEKDNDIKFDRFYKIYLPSYIISILTFILLIGIYFDSNIRLRF